MKSYERQRTRHRISDEDGRFEEPVKLEIVSRSNVDQDGNHEASLFDRNKLGISVEIILDCHIQ